MKKLLAAIFAAAVAAGAAAAQEVTLRLHHFESATSFEQTEVFEPWVQAIEEQSEGRIKIDIYPSMQLGGKPAQLYDQARDGVVDISWTLLGYTPGRFPITDVFELPFVASTAEATTMALQDFQEKYLADEFSDVHPLLLHVPAPGKLHLKSKPVHDMADLKGLKIRVPSRPMTDAFNAMGATAVGMPSSELAQALTTGVVDGAVVPWEIVPTFRLNELTKYHTDFGGPDTGLYASVFGFVMNKAKYEALPDDLKKIIDDNSGRTLAERIAPVYDTYENEVADKAVADGGELTVIPAADLGPWQEATQPVVDAWVAAMDEAGHDGQAILQDARDMIASYKQ